MYCWFTLDSLDLENPSCLTILEIECPLRYAPMICLQSKASKSGSLPILAIPTSNSEQPQYEVHIQLSQRSHLQRNDTQRYTICEALAIP
ncbi:uncharacterized protein TNCV_436971 [Trichonephila clavipes]|nr:uncharacterized protein TNCV_436971 [Trichonephila clavipes]